jgi:AcrR family transcriptional regulator
VATAKEVPRRERILDAAEALFAEHGYDGVTLRRIAREAGVDVALASYHFGKKLDLFEAVFTRRAALLNEARRDALRDCQASAGAKGPSVEQIIEAFLRPWSCTRKLETRAGATTWRSSPTSTTHLTGARE